MSDADARARRRARRIAWAARAGGLLLRVLARTWRIREVNRAPSQALRDKGCPVVLTLWHGEMLPILWAHRNEGIAILVSEHGDGEIIARVAESLGCRTVRGSTTRGAHRALLGLSRVVENGGTVAITPDGPRGPARTFAPGALVVAQRSGAPVVTLAAAARRCWRLSSWDGFVIPMPFTRVTIAHGDPEPVAADTPRDAAAQGRRFEALMERAAEAARG